MINDTKLLDAKDNYSASQLLWR